MDLLHQWRRLEAGLPAGWGEARLALTLADERRRARAAALLAPLAPGRSGNSFRFSAVRRRGGASPGAVARALSRLDEARIEGELELVAADAAPAVEKAVPDSAAESWDRELAGLPSDWSDAWVELRFTSSDDVEPAALFCAPLNPMRTEDDLGLRFRAARRAGYGAAAGLVRRCLERLDERGIPARASVLRALSETRHVSTQGPVWYVGGKVV